jgi:nucleoside-diphosphate-sugar epimerase
LIKKILIFGGSGFLGKHLIQRFLKRKCKIYYVSRKKIKIYNKNLNHIRIDLNIESNFRKLKLLKVDYVIFCAGYVNHDGFFDKNKEVYKVHFLSVIKIVEIFIKKNIKRFLYIGSSDEYGNNNQNVLKESFKEYPSTSYSFSKTAATLFLLMMYKTYKFPVSIIRPFLIFGPDQKSNRFIPYVIKNFLRDKKASLSKCNQVKDFVYIDDFLDLVWLTLNKEKAKGEIFNAGSGKGRILKDVVQDIRKIIKKGTPVYSSFYKNENIVQVASISKAFKLLGWKPRISFKQGLLRTINAFKSESLKL